MIYVLLILAGISIATLSGDNGILQKATDAKVNSEKAQIVESARLDILAGITDKKGTDLTADEIKSILGTYFNDIPVDLSDLTQEMTTISGRHNVKLFEVLEGVIIGTTTPQTQTSGRASLTSQLPVGSTTFSAGAEVTFGDEQFFVLSDDGTNVTLLAKYCLNIAGTLQVEKNDNSSVYSRRFSKTNYWSKNFTSSPFNLQDTAMITAAETDGDVATGISNAVIAAIDYGTSKGATGRLMTYQEAYDIQNGTDSNMKNILWGRWTDGTQPTGGYLNWFLGEARDDDDVWLVYGGRCNFDFNMYDSIYGVRPVLEI